MSLISVIVPCYNVSNYLTDLIPSIINQSYTNLEIILINDGSTDNTYQEMYNFSLTDNRIKIINQNNMGLSTSRNIGIDSSFGDYIVFVDADDFIHVDMINQLYQSALKYPDLLISCGFNYYDDLLKTSSPYLKPSENRLFTIEQVYEDLADSSSIIRFEVWNKIFKKTLIGDIRFKQRQIYEDVYFIRNILKKVSGAFHISNNYYNYRINRPGSTNSKFDIRKIDVIYELECYIEQFNISNDIFLANKYRALRFNTLLSLLSDAVRLNVDNHNLRKILKSHKLSLSYLLNNDISRIKLFTYILCPLFALKLILKLRSRIAIK